LASSSRSKLPASASSSDPSWLVLHRTYRPCGSATTRVAPANSKRSSATCARARVTSVTSPAKEVPCERCVSAGRQKCYLWVVGDEATLVRAKARLQSMYVSHPYLSDVTVSARLRLHIEDNQLNATRDMQNINYCPLTSAEMQRFSEDFLNHDLLVLGLSLMGGMED
jgi:glycosyltransferase A (GT-A) superfamily protein (DUF2064 family)